MESNTMTKKQISPLQQQMRAVAMEYLRQTAELLGRSVRDCYWVGTDSDNVGTYGIADFGDITFLTIDEIQEIINNLDTWVKKYGSREAVAEEIDKWCEWSIQDENNVNGHAVINLRNWLLGYRKSDV